MRSSACLLLISLCAGCNCGGRVGSVHSNLRAEPPALDFGTVAPAAKAARSVKLTNDGQVTLHVLSLGVASASRPGAFEIAVPVSSVGPGGSATIELTFTGDAVTGADSASLQIASDSDDQAELAIALIGRTAETGCVECTDAGLPDAGLPDAGVQDAGFRDAGTADAGPVDGGVQRPDGGFCMQAGVTNALLTPHGGVNLSNAAWTGSELAVVWDEINDAGMEIYFARVSSQGQRVPGSERVVSPLDGKWSSWPRIASSGSGLAVTYIDDRNGSTQRLHVFQRLDLQGNPIGAELILGTGYSGADPAVGWNATTQEWGVVHNSSTATATFTRVSPAGVATTGATVSSANVEYTGTPLKPDGAGWVLVSSATSAINLTRLRGDGSLIGTTPVTATTAPLRPSVAPTGSGYGLIWMDRRFGTMATVVFARADAQGNPIAGSEAPLSSTGRYGGEPDVVWTGSRFVTTWQETENDNGVARGTIWVQQFDANGVADGPARALTCDGQLNWWPFLTVAPGFVALPYTASDALNRKSALGLMTLW